VGSEMCIRDRLQVGQRAQSSRSVVLSRKHTTIKPDSHKAFLLECAKALVPVPVGRLLPRIGFQTRAGLAGKPARSRNHNEQMPGSLL